MVTNAPALRNRVKKAWERSPKTLCTCLQYANARTCALCLLRWSAIHRSSDEGLAADVNEYDWQQPAGRRVEGERTKQGSVPTKSKSSIIELGKPNSDQTNSEYEHLVAIHRPLAALGIRTDI